MFREADDNVISCYKEMFGQIIFGILAIFWNFRLLGIVWLLAPIFAWWISLEKHNKKWNS